MATSRITLTSSWQLVATSAQNFIIDNGSSSNVHVTFQTSPPAVNAAYHVLAAGEGLVRMNLGGDVYARDGSEDVESFSVRELPGNHAFQSTAASRPTYQVNGTTGAGYISFDGSDDFLVTNNINFTATDKVTMFAGVRKLSDAATGIVAELSSAIGVNAGSFALYAPAAAGADKFAFESRGTGSPTRVMTTSSEFNAPTSATLACIGNISGLNVNLRVNGAQVGSSSVSTGTGTYGNYPLYIGRRGGTSAPFNGHLYGLTLVGKIASDPEIKAVEKDIAKKVGVTIPV